MRSGAMADTHHCRGVHAGAVHGPRGGRARAWRCGRRTCRIVPTACGGGFGGKLDVSVQPILAVAAWKTGQARCSLVYSRTESMASTTKRHPARIMGARRRLMRDGRLVAYEMSGDFNTGAYASWGPTVANRVPIHAHGPYKVPNVWNRTRAIYTNETPAGAFRGFGVPQSAIANETLMDDLAEQLGLDRWQIRRVNALGRGERRHRGRCCMRRRGLPQCLDALKPAWDRALAAAAAHNATQCAHSSAAPASPACGTAAATRRCRTRARCGSTLDRDGVWCCLERRGRYRPRRIDGAGADRARGAWHRGRTHPAVRCGRRHGADARRRQDVARRVRRLSRAMPRGWRRLICARNLSGWPMSGADAPMRREWSMRS